MSKKKAEQKVTCLEQVRAKRAIELTIKETKKAMGRAVLKRYARTFTLVGFIFGFATGMWVAWLFWL